MGTNATELPRRFPYNPSWGMLVGGALLFGACSSFMVHKATHNTRGLLLGGIVPLGPTGAVVFYWIMAALAAMFVLAVLLVVVRRIATNRVLELGTDTLLLPYGFLHIKISRIPYAAIEGISEDHVFGQTALQLQVGGRKFAIAASLFADADSYDFVRDFLMSRVHHLRLGINT